MKRKVLSVLSMVMVAASLEAGEFIRAERPIEGSYIVVFRPDAVKRDNAPTSPGWSVRSLAADAALVAGGRVTAVYDTVLEGASLRMTEGAALALARDPRVQLVLEDEVVPAFAIQAVPNHLGLDRIDERDLPRNNHFSYSYTGSGVNIYVIDSGVAANATEFGSRLINTYSTVRDGNGNPLYGDPTGHGTDVAKMVAGSIAGVAKGAKIRAIRVATVSCQQGGGDPIDPPAYGFATTCFSSAALLEAVNWVAANRVKPAVANLSLGTDSSALMPLMDTATTGLINAGVTVVAAAGNSNKSACGISPARVALAITVGASDGNDARAVATTWASNFGSCLDLFAPGKGLLGGTLNGTSFAAPLVAGAAAQYLQNHTAASPATVASYVTTNATSGRLTNIGSGSPNRLLFTPPGGSEVDNPPVANFTYSCTGRTCTFTSTSTDDFAVIGCSYGSAWYGWGGGAAGCLPVAFTFPQSGPWDVVMYVADDGNQVGWILKTILVP